MAKAKTKPIEAQPESNDIVYRIPTQLPNLANATPGFLADEYGELKARLSELERLTNFYKEAIKARLEPGESASGEKYTVMLQVQTQVRLDTAAIRKSMDEDWIAEHSTEIEMAKLMVAKKG